MRLHNLFIFSFVCVISQNSKFLCYCDTGTSSGTDNEQTGSSTPLPSSQSEFTHQANSQTQSTTTSQPIGNLYPEGFGGSFVAIEFSKPSEKVESQPTNLSTPDNGETNTTVDFKGLKLFTKDSNNNKIDIDPSLYKLKLLFNNTIIFFNLDENAKCVSVDHEDTPVWQLDNEETPLLDSGEKEYPKKVFYTPIKHLFIFFEKNHLGYTYSNNVWVLKVNQKIPEKTSRTYKVDPNEQTSRKTTEQTSTYPRRGFSLSGSSPKASTEVPKDQDSSASSTQTSTDSDTSSTVEVLLSDLYPEGFTYVWDDFDGGSFGDGSSGSAESHSTDQDSSDASAEADGTSGAVPSSTDPNAQAASAPEGSPSTTDSGASGTTADGGMAGSSGSSESSEGTGQSGPAETDGTSSSAVTEEPESGSSSKDAAGEGSTEGGDGTTKSEEDEGDKAGQSAESDDPDGTKKEGDDQSGSTGGDAGSTAAATADTDQTADGTSSSTPTDPNEQSTTVPESSKESAETTDGSGTTPSDQDQTSSAPANEPDQSSGEGSGTSDQDSSVTTPASGDQDGSGTTPGTDQSSEAPTTTTTTDTSKPVKLTGVELSLKKTSGTNEFSYNKTGNVVTYEAKSGFGFSSVKTKKGGCNCCGSTCNASDAPIWDAANESEYANKVVLDGKGKKVKTVTIHLPNDKKKSYYRPEKSKPWVEGTAPSPVSGNKSKSSGSDGSGFSLDLSSPKDDDSNYTYSKAHGADLHIFRIKSYCNEIKCESKEVWNSSSSDGGKNPTKVKYHKDKNEITIEFGESKYKKFKKENNEWKEENQQTGNDQTGKTGTGGTGTGGGGTGTGGGTQGSTTPDGSGGGTTPDGTGTGTGSPPSSGTNEHGKTGTGGGSDQSGEGGPTSGGQGGGSPPSGGSGGGTTGTGGRGTGTHSSSGGTGKKSK